LGFRSSFTKDLNLNLFIILVINLFILRFVIDQDFLQQLEYQFFLLNFFLVISFLNPSFLIHFNCRLVSYHKQKLDQQGDFGIILGIILIIVFFPQ